eukprot:scaffold7017_cov134-Cylindrotheca_fusiformis.AAC.13
MVNAELTSSSLAVEGDTSAAAVKRIERNFTIMSFYPSDPCWGGLVASTKKGSCKISYGAPRALDDGGTFF